MSGCDLARLRSLSRSLILALAVLLKPWDEPDVLSVAEFYCFNSVPISSIRLSSRRSRSRRASCVFVIVVAGDPRSCLLVGVRPDTGNPIPPVTADLAAATGETAPGTHGRTTTGIGAAALVPSESASCHFLGSSSIYERNCVVLGASRIESLRKSSRATAGVGAVKSVPARELKG